MKVLLCSALLLVAQTTESPLRFETTPAGQRVVARLPALLANRLPAGSLAQAQGEAVLTLSRLSESKSPGPSMLGKYERSGTQLTFTPRLPLSPGAAYRATLKLSGRIISLDCDIPKPSSKAPPRVVKIYPTADVLPANLLRFYIYFDRPMRGGKQLFEHLAILDDKGKEVEEPWLVDEIWDEENDCLILFIHPGRIKWGVELRELMGPVLLEKRSYTLVVRGDWTDLQGNKLGKDTLKKFRTTAEDRVRIELKDWKLSSPAVGTREAVRLTFSNCLDERSLHTGLTIRDAKGQIVPGTIAIEQNEKSWRFTPTRPWQAGPHRVVVSSDLEDVAGNTPDRPFDMDLLAPRPAAQKLLLDFHPR
jgi:hypothetical protein